MYQIIILMNKSFIAIVSLNLEALCAYVNCKLHMFTNPY